MPSQGCGTPVSWYQVNERTYQEHEMKTSCGTYETDLQGRQQQRFCDRCNKRYAKMYPQGWETYPGDICPHGDYVGGIGPDLMCGLCEGGGVYPDAGGG